MSRRVTLAAVAAVSALAAAGIGAGLTAALSGPEAATTAPSPTATAVSPRVAEVPLLVGLREDEARQQAQAAGFVITIVGERAVEQDEGFVVRQAPPAGKSVPLGSALTLVVAGRDLTAATGGRSASSPRGPFLLVTLPSLGTVTWTCDRPERYPSFTLGYRASPRYATTTIELRADRRRVARRVVQPGQRIRLPFSSARTQTLSFVQSTGAGELRASVFVDFVPNTPVIYCWPYAPPKITVQVSERR